MTKRKIHHQFPRSTHDRFMASISTQWEFSKNCREGVPLLAFHRIGKRPAYANLPQLYVSPAHFLKLLDGFKRENLQSISISEAIQTNAKIGSRFVISFDDGYEGALIYAAQTMRELGCSAIQFIVADRLGQRNEWDLGRDTAMERLMDRTQVQEWLSLGFEIGAHTLTHAKLPAIPIAAAKNEIAGSKKKLEDLFGVPVKHFAYPYGDYNDRIAGLVRDAGFETACTCDPEVVCHDVDPFRLGRFLIWDETKVGRSMRFLTKALKKVGGPGLKRAILTLQPAFRMTGIGSGDQ